jgi:hypothetical protein
VGVGRILDRQSSRPLEVITPRAPTAMAPATSSAHGVLMVGSATAWGVTYEEIIDGANGIPQLSV